MNLCARAAQPDMVMTRRHGKEGENGISTIWANRLFRTLFGPDYFPRNLRVVEELKALAAEYQKTLPQCALRWTLSHPVVSVALVGCRQPAEVAENLGALGWAISAADMAAIDAIFARHGAVTTPPGWLEDD